MIQKRTCIFFYCILFVLQVNAQDTDGKKIYFQGYSGGMMLHTGYLFSGEVNIYNDITHSVETIDIQGMPVGIGGLMRFHFGKHFRVGGEGYSSTLHYGKNKSYMTLGWGGVLFDCRWVLNKFTIFLGGTIGGGSVKNVTVANNASSHSIEKNALYRKYAVMIIDPFIGMEYAVNRSIHLIAKIDYIISVNGSRSDFAMGPRIYLGVIFSRSKDSKR